MKKFETAGAGWIIAFCLMSLYQDAFGKDAYIEYVRNHWVPATWSVPIAVVALILSVWSLARR